MFDLAGERCGLPSGEVREVLRAALPARLPTAPPIVIGVLNVRGELVPLLDIRQLLGLPARPLLPEDHLILAHARQRLVALAVDRVTDVARIPAAEMRPAADFAPDASRIAGVARLADGALVIYDLQEFLSADEALALDRSLAGAPAP